MMQRVTNSQILATETGYDHEDCCGCGPKVITPGQLFKKDDQIHKVTPSQLESPQTAEISQKQRKAHIEDDISPEIEYEMNNRRADILQPTNRHNSFSLHHSEVLSYMGGERNIQRRVDRNDSDENEKGLATTVANANSKKRSKTTDKAKDDRQNKYKDLVGDFDQDEIELFIKHRGRLGNHFGTEQIEESQAAPSQDFTRNAVSGPVDAENDPKIPLTADYVKNIYTAVEREHEPKKKFSDRDWMSKNTQEKPQSFGNFKQHVRNWDINECIIFEMWEEQEDEVLRQQERNFQKMLVNNMESVFKIFFRGMATLRVKSQAQRDPSQPQRKPSVEQSLTVLEQKKVVATRVRPDTQVKQFHAGHIFDYLKKNIKLKQNQCLLVLTNADLYPKDGWTFVFGMTKQSWRICIQSYARHHPNFAMEGQNQRVFTSKIARKVQYRAVKTACHEIAHVLSIRHCQAYECLMNGSSQLDEADRKPFALCPVCLRKMSSYLGFNGQELQLYKEMRDVFKLMNHNDKQQSFKREIRLFDKCIQRIEELNQNGGNLPKGFDPNESRISQQSDNEGGHIEQIKRIEEKAQAEILIKKNEEKVSEVSSDITYKAVSEIASGNQISVNELRREQVGSENAMAAFCRMLGSCFNCFQAPKDDGSDFRNRGKNDKTNVKGGRKGVIDAPVIEMGVKVDLEKGQINSNSANSNNRNTSSNQSKNKQEKGKKGKETPIYLLDSQHGVHQVHHRQKAKR